MSHNFKLANADTDSISFCKQDGSEFSEEEQEGLLKELNSLYPPRIRFEHDGIFKRVLILRKKNYALWDGKKLKIKGSGLRDTKREKAIQELIKEMIECLIFEKSNPLEIYTRYIKEAMDVKDINRWSCKKSITQSVLEPKRTNEKKVLDALQGTEYSQGDKRHFFYKLDGSLCLVDKFDGEYDKIRLLKRIYNTIEIFENVIDSAVFIKYHNKKNRTLLEQL